MHKFITTIFAATLSLTISSSALASPKQLITHNLTNYESNAFVAGTIPSQYPTKAHADGKVFWAAVRMACFGHIVDGKCPALIRIGTDTDNPIDVGTVELNIETGAITPNMIRSHGYLIVVNGMAETTITQE